MVLTEELIIILNKLAEQLGIVINWTDNNTVENLETLLLRFIKFEITTSVFWLGLSCFLVIIGLFSYRKTKYFYNKSDDLNVDNINTFICAGCIIIAIAGLVLGFAGILYNSYNLMTCLIYPEKLLLEELHNIKLLI